ncbi:MAG: hypothetical protein MI924_19460 [Chloroflexales bacterium]|nr:hypothetical protein [Chloroflexales bacterium]
MPEGIRHGPFEPPRTQPAGGLAGAAPPAGWRGWPRPRVRGAQPRAGGGMLRAGAERINRAVRVQNEWVVILL